MECTICKDPILTISDCSEAIGICSLCRLTPSSLTLARKRMNAHMKDHREAGHFIGFEWRDPQNWLPAVPSLTPAQRRKHNPIDPLKMTTMGRKWGDGTVETIRPDLYSK